MKGLFGLAIGLTIGYCFGVDKTEKKYKEENEKTVNLIKTAISNALPGINLSGVTTTK